jgi:hypothetical protein
VRLIRNLPIILAHARNRRRKKGNMQNSKRNKMKITATTFAIILIASATLMALPVQAQTDEGYQHGSPSQGTGSGISGALPAGATPQTTVDTTAFLSFRPNPVGIGQIILVNIWTTSPISPMRFHQGYTVTFTKPDGTKDVVGPMESYAADATAWFEYVVDQVGTWKVQFTFPGEYYPAGQWYNGWLVTNSSGYALGSAYYQPDSTDEQELVVQTDQVFSWPPSPLPTDYWTRPVHLENRHWWSILGSYPANGVVGGGPDWPENTNVYMSNYEFLPYVQGPNTGHIVWKRQGANAGIIGGTAGQYSISGNPGAPSVIYNGRCYQTMTVPVNGVPTSCAVCYDLRTGQQYYAIPISQGGATPQVVSYTRATAVAVAGATESNTYSVDLLSLSGNRLIKINPYTGAVTLNVTGMTPQLLGGSQGSTEKTGFYSDPYVLSVQTTGSGPTTKYFLINWTTAGTSTNFTTRIQSNITLPWGFVNWGGGILGFSGIVADFESNIMVWMVGIAPISVGVYYGTWMMAINMNTGQLLWNKTYTETRYSTACLVADHGKIAVLMEKGSYYAYDIFTGNLAWKSEMMSYPWGSDSFGAYAVQSAYGLLYRESYDGVYAFDWETGKIAWFYKAPAVAYETPYTDANGSGVYSFNGGGFVADGKLYTYNTEHTPTYPRTRGWKLHCINATTGEGIWTMMGSQNPGAIADGYLVNGNPDDGYTYAYGKGKSATTVTAAPKTIANGNNLLIEGTVLDMSPAQPDTPCVSKDSMTTQMQYLHMQLPIDGAWNNETIEGVKINLSAIGSKGTVVEIGTVTTNGYYGTFSQAWTPPTEETYTIIASFAGDDSYGSSSAATAVTVGPAPQTPATPEGTSPTDLTPVYYGIAAAAIAIIIAIAIVGIMILRKH